MSEEERRTLADLPPPDAAGGCRFCGETASVEVNLRVRDRKKGRGQGTPPTHATRRWLACEHHAVQMFEKVNSAFPGGS